MSTLTRDLLADPIRSKEIIAELRTWYTASTPTPIGLTDVLVPSFATGLSDAMASLPNWKHVVSLTDGHDRVTNVELHEWLNAQADQRFSSQRVAEARSILLQQVPLKPESKSFFAEFFLYFIIGTTFRKWISSITGVPIAKEVTCEFAQYYPCDYIAEHADRHDGRIIGVNLYLGPWQPGSGGRLGYRNGDGTTNYIAPATNTMSLFRVLDGCVHWVEPWVDPQPGRRTVSMSFREMK